MKRGISGVRPKVRITGHKSGKRKNPGLWELKLVALRRIWQLAGDSIEVIEIVEVEFQAFFFFEL